MLSRPQTKRSSVASVHSDLYLTQSVQVVKDYFAETMLDIRYTSTPQLPFKEPQIPSNRDHKALNRGTLGGLGIDFPLHGHLDP